MLIHHVYKIHLLYVTASIKVKDEIANVKQQKGDLDINIEFKTAMDQEKAAIGMSLV